MKPKVKAKTLFELDRDHVWHPYTQEKIAGDPFLVKRAQAEFLYVEDKHGKESKIIDAVSSWWVNIHGHNHPDINQAIIDQLKDFGHVIFAGMTHEPAINLVSSLIDFLPQVDLTLDNPSKSKLTHGFFSDNGSTAVEVGIKMAIQYFYNTKSYNKNRVLALCNSYHGDTVGTMSTSNTPIFHQAFKSLLYDVDFIPSPAPAFKRNNTSLTHDEQKLFKEEAYNFAEKQSIKALEDKLKLHPNKHACIILEPLVQGAGGMKFYRKSFLQAVRRLCREHNVLMIADEVMTGFGRTGEDFACKRANIMPDIICLSKGLTAGYLPMSLTFCTDEIYQAFYADSKLKTFFHGHSYTANAIACATALASLNLYQRENRLDDVRFINMKMCRELLVPEIEMNPIVTDVRVIGGIAVIEFLDEEQSAYCSNIGDYLKQAFLKRHILMRPLGNILYFMPPYTITVESLEYTLQAIKDVIHELSNKYFNSNP
jgi:adenosylmethionine-8-amino-7-oxononanoate aminotransferase